MENMNPLFVSAFLSIANAKLQAERKSYGSVIHHLALKELMNLKIPIPSKEIQDEIADRVKQNLEESEKLKTEAQLIVKKAKRMIEEMIQGKARAA